MEWGAISRTYINNSFLFLTTRKQLCRKPLSSRTIKEERAFGKSLAPAFNLTCYRNKIKLNRRIKIITTLSIHTQPSHPATVLLQTCTALICNPIWHRSWEIICLLSFLWYKTNASSQFYYLQFQQYKNQ